MNPEITRAMFRASVAMDAIRPDDMADDQRAAFAVLIETLALFASHLTEIEHAKRETKH